MDVVVAEGVAQLSGSFEDFYAAAWPKLVAFATTITRDPQASHEVVQEALTRCLARWLLLREPMAFALRVTRNLAIDQVRRAGRETVTDRVPERAVPASSHPDLLLVVLRLPADLRDVLVLHYFLDQPVAVVARVLGRPTGTVKRRLHEARKALEILMGDDRDR